MSFGAGHVQDMNNRMKQNREQRPSNRSKFKENNRELLYSKDKKSKTSSFKTVPEKKLNEIRTFIRKRAKAERKKEQIILGFLFLGGLILTIGILIWLN